MSAKISIDRKRIAEFCRRHHIRKLALFGSVLRNDFRSDSDVDVLVEFESGATAGFLRLSADGAGTDRDARAPCGSENACGIEPLLSGRGAERGRGPVCRGVTTPTSCAIWGKIIGIK